MIKYGFKIKGFLILACLIGCAPKLYQTWHVIEDTEWLQQANYRSHYRFTKDTLYFRFLGEKERRFRINEITNFTIDLENVDALHFRFNKDTLILKHPRTELKLLPFHPLTINKQKSDLKQYFEDHYFSISFDDFHHEIYLYPYANGYPFGNAEVHSYYRGRYVGTLVEPIWFIDEFQNQHLLVIEAPFESWALSNTYYPNEVDENGTLNASTWFGGKFHQLQFRHEKLPDSAILLNQSKLLNNQWKLTSADNIEPVLPEDSTLIALGHVIGFNFDLDKVIHTSDLENLRINLIFLPDDTFQLIVDQRKIYAGKWSISRNGKLILVSENPKVWEDFSTDWNNFIILTLSENRFETELEVPIYKDSALHNTLYRLIFNAVISDEK